MFIFGIYNIYINLDNFEINNTSGFIGMLQGTPQNLTICTRSSKLNLIFIGSEFINCKNINNEINNNKEFKCYNKKESSIENNIPHNFIYIITGILIMFKNLL